MRGRAAEGSEAVLGRVAEGGEAVLGHAWAALGKADPRLVTQEGEALRVLFPGIRNRGPGPDFQRAVLVTERGRVVRGDVEVHQASSAWAGHGHQSDARYNRVVLHVVAQDDVGSATELASGARVPVLVLRILQPAAADEAAPHPCGPCRRAGALWPQVAATLEEQGWLRFQARVRALVRLMQQRDPDQLLYEEVMEGLGYALNRAPFRRLAQALPWKAVQQEASRWPREALVPKLREILLGLAGFPDHPGVGQAPMGAQEAWCVSGLRPSAHPRLRLLGVAALLARWLPEGPVAHLVRLGSGVDGALGVSGLRRAYSVNREASGLNLTTSPIGQGRADVLAVNVALPFLGAWSQLTERLEMWQAVVALYRSYLGLEPDGVVRGMAQGLGLPIGQAGPPAGQAGLHLPGMTACQQQGLHHLFRRYCLRARQSACPLGRLTAGASGQG